MNTFKSTQLYLPVFCFLISSLLACGYRLTGSISSLPPHIKQIFIPIFKNSSKEPGIENSITSTIRREFINDGRLKVSGQSDADMVLEGQVIDLSVKPVAFDSTDNATEYWVILQVLVKAKEKEKGILFFDKMLKTKWDYTVSSNLISSEEARLQAIKEAEKNLSRQLIGMIIEGF